MELGVMNRRLYIFLIFTVSFLLTFIESASAQSEFAPDERFIEETVLQGLPIATSIAFAPDSRLYLGLKEGIVRVVRNGTLLATPFININTIVNKSTDRGLLGIAVDPQFPSRPFVYISYVYDPPGFTADTKDPRVIRIVRYTADAAQGYNVALPGSEEIILGKNSTPEHIAPPTAADNIPNPERASCMSGLTMAGSPIEDCIPADSLSHTAGTLLFGADGALYASFGDGSNYDYPSTLAFRAQSADAMSGRVVRVDPNTGQGLPGNPFYDDNNPGSNRSRLWSLGFRNPFRITINPSNGEVFAGDVGTSYYEEINQGKGGNFGWPCYEGGFIDRAQQEGQATINERQVGFKKAPTTLDFCNAIYAQGAAIVKAPLFTYRHPYDATGKDLGSSVTGIAFYTGVGYPQKYRGALFYADYARKFLRYLTFDERGVPTTHDFAKEVGTNYGAIQLIIGPDTNLYAVFLDLKTRTSEIRRFRAIEGLNNPPSVKIAATPTAGNIPLVVEFSSTGTGDVDGQGLEYSWNFGDGGTSTEANPTHVFTKVGTYEVSLTAKETTEPFASSTRKLTIRTGVTPPIAFIDEPSTDLRYEIGKTVRFSGHTEPSTGVSMSWAVLQRHNQHEHLVTEVLAQAGSFVPEEHCDNCAYELCLMVTGTDQLIDQKCRDVLPLTTKYTFSSKPPGASITYVDEEREVLAPHVAEPIVGSRQTISAAPVSLGRSFIKWSDGVKESTRTFITGTTETNFEAVYINRNPLLRLKMVRGTKRSPLSVTLDASGTRDPEGEPLSFRWRFSDRKSLRGAIITRRFKRAGTYAVTLTASDRIGGTVVYRGTVRVGKKSGLRRVSVQATKER